MPFFFKIFFVLFLSFSSYANENIDIKVKKLTLELRCMTCQNQSVYDSDSDYSKDIKIFVKEKFEEGLNEKEIPELYILGFSHKDDLNDSKKYLEEEGNPYSFVGIDRDGKIAFDFGVFGLPETFIINKDGEIIYKHTGPLTKKIIEDEIAILF